jgi:hypothetical protein
MKKIAIAFICFLTLSFSSYAQQRKGIARLMPQHLKLQFAGSIGFISAGFGYESPNKKFQGDFFYGYVPESVGGVTIHSVTGKFTWMALSKEYAKDWRVDFLTAGVLINYAFGKQYFLFSPENYPYKYYGFPTALHAGIFVGSSVTKKRWGLYCEVGSTAKDILSYVNNTGSLRFDELLNIGIGTRVILH